MGDQMQPDGWYPRVNAEMVKSGEHVDMIVSLVGSLVSTDGQIVNLK